jgi:hypothetical protein
MKIKAMTVKELRDGLANIADDCRVILSVETDDGIYETGAVGLITTVVDDTVILTDTFSPVFKVKMFGSVL